MKYRFGGREKLLALGVYPQASLQGARKAREDARTVGPGKFPGREAQGRETERGGRHGQFL
ncbi:MAG: Arm DNA-binding domain-containing protein [Pseudomonadota bacterium]